MFNFHYLATVTMPEICLSFNNHKDLFNTETVQEEKRYSVLEELFYNLYQVTGRGATINLIALDLVILLFSTNLNSYFGLSFTDTICSLSCITISSLELCSVWVSRVMICNVNIHTPACSCHLHNKHCECSLVWW